MKKGRKGNRRGRKVNQRCINEQLGLRSPGEPRETVEQVSEFSDQRMGRLKFMPRLPSPGIEGLPQGNDF